MTDYGEVATTGRDDGLHIDRADERICVALELLQLADREHLEAKTGRLTFTGANRTATYTVVGYDPVARGLICERLA